ncbi:tRNA (guanosine(37)-N1)-methyltransferase TrmD [bacterium]|nr:tRNA (guanosine(37)-N1)-methyltransferase TrmD [bacterium]
MRIDVITPFPDLLAPVLNESMLKQAQSKDLVCMNIWDLREFSVDKHRTVDDYPYGGGAGMVMKPEPIFLAMDRIISDSGNENPYVIFMSPQGQTLKQEKSWSLSKEKHLVFICGHYRGVDERVIKTLVTEEISIGDYILTGGELPAAVVIDTVVRLLPGVLGDFDSAEGDTFSGELLDYPHYTRPLEYRGQRVPDVLVSGHHANVEKWRKEQALNRTQEKRPDLLKIRKKA